MSRKEKDRAYYEANKERITAQKREYNRRNAEKMAAAKKRYEEVNRVRMQAKRREWRERNKEKLRRDKLMYYLKNKAREDARVRAWRTANPDRLQNYWRDWYYGDLEHSRAQAIDNQARRRSRLGDGRVTRADWTRIKDEYGHRCAYCARHPARLEQEHLEPLSRGGTHDPDNVVPACRQCNASKSDASLLLWLAR